MKKSFFHIFSAFFIASLLYLFHVPNAYAYNISVTQSPEKFYANATNNTLTFTDASNSFDTSKKYRFWFFKPGETDINNITKAAVSDEAQPINNNTLVFSISRNVPLDQIKDYGTWNYKLSSEANRFALDKPTIFQGSFYMYPPGGSTAGIPKLQLIFGTTYQVNTSIKINLLHVQPNQNYTVWWDGNTDAVFSNKVTDIGKDALGRDYTTISIKTQGPVGTKTLCLVAEDTVFNQVISFPCSNNIPNITILREPVPTPSVLPEPVESSLGGGVPTGPPEGTPEPTPSTAQIKPTEIPPPPPPCSTPGDNGGCKTINTGLGIPIKTDPEGFVASLFGFVLGIAGTIALLIIMYSGYRFMTSQGNPEKIQGARETITSTVVGLLFILFSLVLLEIIGVDILRIPGFSR